MLSGTLSILLYGVCCIVVKSLVQRNHGATKNAAADIAFPVVNGLSHHHLFLCSPLVLWNPGGKDEERGSHDLAFFFVCLTHFLVLARSALLSLRPVQVASVNLTITCEHSALNLTKHWGNSPHSFGNRIKFLLQIVDLASIIYSHSTDAELGCQALWRDSY